MKRAICLFAVLFLFTTTQSLKAQNLLEDGFESGNRSSPIGGAWRISPDTTTVSPENPRTGLYSLRFQFDSNPTGDAMAEQRADLLQTNELWGRMYLYIPTNYYHRNVSPSNNKFWAVYASPYTSPGFQMNLSLSAGLGGNSNLQVHRYDNGKEMSVLSPYSNFITSADRGKWIEVMIRVKVPTNNTSNDGIIQVWKNGTSVANYKQLDMYGSNGRNYIDQMYLLGWSNSGFDATTIMYIDDVVISNTPIDITSITPVLIGIKAPNNLRITN